MNGTQQMFCFKETSPTNVAKKKMNVILKEALHQKEIAIGQLPVSWYLVNDGVMNIVAKQIESFLPNGLSKKASFF